MYLGDCNIYRILIDLGVDVEQCRQDIMNVLERSEKEKKKTKPENKKLGILWPPPKS